MTFRAWIIGFALGLAIAALTIANDALIWDRFLISTHLPISVFGVLVILLLGANPLLRALGPRAPLTISETAIIAAIALASCGWPSFGFYWGFIPNVASPTHWLGHNSAWRANHVMAYVPNASSEIGHGHVTNWQQLAQHITDPANPDTTIPAQIHHALGPYDRQVIHDAAHSDRPDVPAATDALNRIIRDHRLRAPPNLDTTQLPAPVRALLTADDTLTDAQRALVNRWLIVAAFDHLVLPPPQGGPILLAGDARADAAAELALLGRGGGDTTILHEIDWQRWWPTLRLWIGLALLLAIAALCLSLIVHPQWAGRELLSYPLAQLVAELGKRETNRAIPDVARQGLFWVGFCTVAAIHLLNGFNRWFPLLPTIPLTLDFTPLQELFPNASRVHGSHALFSPRLYLTAIAFAFFLNTRVSFSVGFATFVYVAFGAFMIARGVPMAREYMAPTPDNMMRFGAYLAMTLLILYIGRRYYTTLARQVVGLTTHATRDDVPAYAVWAGRGLLATTVAAVLVLRYAGLDWLLASAFVLIVLMMFLILSRIVCETGMYFVQSAWLPITALTALFGFDAIGPTSYIILAVASITIVGDPRTTWMPYLSTALAIVQRTGGRVTASLSLSMLAMLILACLVAGVATFAVINEHGAINRLGLWSAEMMPAHPFEQLAAGLAELQARQSLVHATINDGLTSLAHIRLDATHYAWIAAGAVLLLATAWARLRVSWFPIHPVLFLIWGIMPAHRFAISFLIGWAIKAAVVQLAGARGYRAALPLMIGVLAADLLLSLFWAGVSASHYIITEGRAPDP